MDEEVMNHTPKALTPITLTIAGSDCSGGAGIQADIKAISATGGYACSVITALTAQNTQGVNGILPISADFIEAQLDAIFTDLNVRAVKIGMLASKNIIESIATKLKQYQPPFLVLDPVMVASTGALLLPHDAIDALCEHLLPMADVLTPNLPEAAALLGCQVPTDYPQMQGLTTEFQRFIRQHQQDGKTPSVLLKGGHLFNEALSRDILITPTDVIELSTTRVDTQNTHGTGCTLSSAIASYLAQGLALKTSVQKAKDYLTEALSHANELNVGQGIGPVDHFYTYRA
jgi:hydroxymethylpyrimidine/phosphomethylpyrimidine kinase